MARDDKIGPTAHYTAYVWHRLRMPHAALFATPKGARLFWSFRLAGEWLATLSPGAATMQDYLAVRHRLIEGALEEYRPDRVVEIGAGLSRRGVTWAAEHGVHYVELDLPAMARAKRALLEKRASRDLLERLGDRLRIEEADILDPAFGERLEAVLRGASRPAVIAEGVTSYFDREERRHIAESIRRGLQSAGGGIFLCDIRTRAAGRTFGPASQLIRPAIRIATRGRGARPLFADDADVRSFFAAAGFPHADKLEASRLPDLAHLRQPGAVWRFETK